MGLLENLKRAKKQVCIEKHPFAGQEVEMREIYASGVAMILFVDEKHEIQEKEKECLANLLLSLDMPEGNLPQILKNAHQNDETAIQKLIETLSSVPIKLRFLFDLQALANAIPSPLPTIYLEGLQGFFDLLSFPAAELDAFSKNFCEWYKVSLEKAEHAFNAENEQFPSGKKNSPQLGEGTKAIGQISFQEDKNSTSAEKKPAKGKFYTQELHKAVNERNFEKLKELVESGADIESLDDEKRTPLCHAYNTTPEIVDYLIKLGANLEAKNDQEETPLFNVCSYSTKGNTVSLLVDAGANIHARDKYGYTPLHSAYTRKAISILLENGADLFAENNHGELPIHSICRFGKSSDAIETVIQAGATIFCKCKNGSEPLHYAAENTGTGACEIIEYLVQKGANINTLNNKGETPLHLAIQKLTDLNLERVNLIIKLGAKLDIRTRKDDFSGGETPLDIAKRMANMTWYADLESPIGDR